MKFLAIIDVVDPSAIADIRAGLRDELRAAWALYGEGALREAYATDRPTRVVFALECEDAQAAAQRLDALPLIAARRLAYELIELRPFVNWAALFAP